jgi:hypothetical protein
MYGPMNVKNECQHIEFANFWDGNGTRAYEATFMQLDEVICIRQMKNLCYAV